MFGALVADAPVERASPNASSNRDVVGSIVLPMPGGHKRCAPIAALPADGVRPELPGMSRLLSDTAVRRWLAGIEASRGIACCCCCGGRAGRKRDVGETDGQFRLSFAAVDVQEGEYEYSALVTLLDEQSTSVQRWHCILSHALRHVPAGREPRPPPRLPMAAT